MAGREKGIQHYNNSQKILLVGEGDFSFSACLAKAFGSSLNMFATSLHSKEFQLVKHSTSESNIEELERRGCRVVYEVDVGNMDQHPALKNTKFDVIVFNFPHAGHQFCLNETDPRLILRHKELLKAYFKSSKGMVQVGGEIHVTHRDDYPYHRWEVEKIGREAGFELREKAEFSRWDYPGYCNKRGSTSRCDSEFPLKQCFTFIFSLTSDQQLPPKEKEDEEDTPPSEHCTTEGGTAVLGEVNADTLDGHLNKSGWIQLRTLRLDDDDNDDYGDDGEDHDDHDDNDDDDDDEEDNDAQEEEKEDDDDDDDYGDDGEDHDDHDDNDDDDDDDEDNDAQEEEDVDEDHKDEDDDDNDGEDDDDNEEDDSEDDL